jgi:hypothetical protein
MTLPEKTLVCFKSSYFSASAFALSGLSRSAFSAQTVDTDKQSTKHAALEIIFFEKEDIKSNRYSNQLMGDICF